MEAYLMKVQRLNNNFWVTCNHGWRTFVCNSNMALIIPYMYNYVTKVCKTQSIKHTCNWTEKPSMGNVRGLPM